MQQGVVADNRDLHKKFCVSGQAQEARCRGDHATAQQIPGIAGTACMKETNPGPQVGCWIQSSCCCLLAAACMRSCGTVACSSWKRPRPFKAAVEGVNTKQPHNTLLQPTTRYYNNTCTLKLTVTHEQKTTSTCMHMLLVMCATMGPLPACTSPAHSTQHCCQCRAQAWQACTRASAALSSAPRGALAHHRLCCSATTHQSA